MDQHKSPSKPFWAKNHHVRPPHLTPPSLPFRATRGRAQKGRGCQAQHMALGLGTTEVEVPAGPFSFYKAVRPPTHTHPPTQHTPQADGESTQSSLREKWGDRDCDSSELHSPFLSLLHLFSVSSLLQAKSCTCDTTDSLMLHYTYTSMSLSVSLQAMFPDVASKLGHEHDTRRHRRGWRWYKTVQNTHFVCHCFLHINGSMWLVRIYISIDCSFKGWWCQGHIYKFTLY